MKLDALQRSMIEAIDKGPDHVADTAFVGGRKGALRGLSVHANTISHARLVALEETFPKLRDLIGEERFNQLSREYVGRNEAIGEPLNAIGRHFAQFMREKPDCDNTAAALADFEWAWLESYHAADAEALTLAQFADADEESLLNTIVALHPASRITPASARAALLDEVPGLADCAAILLTRPQADVLVSPASEAMVRQIDELAEPQPFCNLLGNVDEQLLAQGLQASMAMLEAGALVLFRQESNLAGNRG